MSREETIRPWWRLGPLAWFGILLLVLVNVAVFTDWLTVDRRNIIWLVYCCDPHRWPTVFAYLLWGTLLWTVAGLPRWPKVVHQLRWILLVLVMVGIAVTLFIQYDVHTLAVRRKIYHAVYIRYFVSPYTNYMVDGRLHWTMIITPLTGAIALGSLIYLAVRLRKQQRHVENNQNDQT